MVKYIFYVFVIGLTLSSCKVGAPDFRGSDGFKLEKMDGREIYAGITAKVYNPNWFAIKLKKTALDVYMEEQYMGKIMLDKKLKLKAKRESALNVALHAQLEEGAMISMLRYSAKENVNVRIEGKIKAGVWFFTKKISVNETHQIPGKSLRPGGLLNIGK